MGGAELKTLRVGAGLKAWEVARALDISPTTLSRYECGHAPVPQTVALAVRHLCEPRLAPESAEERLISAIKEVARA